MSKIKVIIPVSGNPFHYGHLQLYKTAEQIFGKDTVQVVIALNPEKVQEISRILWHMVPYNVNYVALANPESTIADYCKENNIRYYLRGIRGAADAEYELGLSYTNRLLNDQLQCLIIPTNEEYTRLSSSWIKQLLKLKKYDVLAKYMDPDAMWRYVYGHCDKVIYFGRSCVGKSTWLKTLTDTPLDMDRELKLIVDDLSINYNGMYDHASNVFKGHLRTNDPAGFVEYFRKLVTPGLAEGVFATLDRYSVLQLDWAAVWAYARQLNPKTRAKYRFVELTCSKEQQLVNAQHRSVSQQYLDTLNAVYDLQCMPIYCDETIDLSDLPK